MEEPVKCPTCDKLRAEVERLKSMDLTHAVIAADEKLRAENEELKEEKDDAWACVQKTNEKCFRLETALKDVNHAIANAQEWYVSDPEDSDMDRDQQIGNWIERAFDIIKEALKDSGSELG